jgi:hypothetical protein
MNLLIPTAIILCLLSVVDLSLGEAPVANVSEISTTEDNWIIFELGGSDPDDDSFVAIVVDPPPCIDFNQGDCLGVLCQLDENLGITEIFTESNTLVTNPQRLVLYWPLFHRNGGTVMKYKLQDSTGENSSDTLIHLLVYPVNDAPVANMLEDPRNVYVPNTDLVLGYVVYLSITDVDHQLNHISGTFLTLPDRGTLYRQDATTPITEGNMAFANGEHTFVFKADPLTSGFPYTSFTWKANDGSLDSNVATDIINVWVCNTPPDPDGVANTSVTVLEDHWTYIYIGAIDPDEEDTIFFFLTKLPDHGSLEIFQRDETWGTITSVPVQLLDTLYSGEIMTLKYTPHADFNTPSGTPPDTITYTLRDTRGFSYPGEPEVELFVTPVNDAPAITCTSTTAYRATPPGTKHLSGAFCCNMSDDALPSEELTVTFSATGATFLDLFNQETGTSLSRENYTHFSVTGNLTTLNYACSGILFAPDACATSYPCNGIITIVIEDFGHHGEGPGNSNPLSTTLLKNVTIYEY